MYCQFQTAIDDIITVAKAVVICIYDADSVNSVTKMTGETSSKRSCSPAHAVTPIRTLSEVFLQDLPAICTYLYYNNSDQSS